MTPENKKKWATEVARRQNIELEMDYRSDLEVKLDIVNENAEKISKAPDKKSQF